MLPDFLEFGPQFFEFRGPLIHQVRERQEGLRQIVGLAHITVDGGNLEKIKIPKDQNSWDMRYTSWGKVLNPLLLDARVSLREL